MGFLPMFDGRYVSDSLPADLTERIAARVETGLFVAGSRKRANYRVVSQDPDVVHFVAADWWSAINVGLNDVTIRREDEHTACFVVTYWKWTQYVVLLGAAIAVSIVLGITAMNALGYQDGDVPFEHPIFWMSVFFWGICWPWLLVAMHKRPARQCLERILAEVSE